MENSTDKTVPGTDNSVTAADIEKTVKKPFFTYERALLFVTIFFALWFIGSVIVGATNRFHHLYDDAQAKLVVLQNSRLALILFIPYIMEKFFGIRIEIKILIFFYLFAFVAAVVGETFTVYYRTPPFDKILHAISGFIALYFCYGAAYLVIKNGTGDHKFLSALFLGFIAAQGVAAIWEMLEFAYDLIFHTNMQKILPPQFFNGGDSFANLNGSDEDIARFYRTPDGYKYALMDSMWDMVAAFFASVAFAAVMIIIKKFKKNAFENCMIYNPDLRMGLIKNRKKKNSAAKSGVTDTEIKTDTE